MSFTQQHVFVAGDTLNASELDINYKELKHYVNGSNVAADLAADSVGTNEIVKGEYLSVVSDHLFTIGDMHTNYVNIDVNNRDYFTYHYKAVDALDNIQTISIPGTGKEFYLEKDADVLYETYIHTQIYANYSAAVMGSASTEYSAFYVYVNGTRQDSTVCYGFSENYTGGFVNPDPGIAGVSGDMLVQRSIVMSFLAWNLKEGMNKIEVRGHIRSDKGRASARTSQIEVFYK